MTRICGRSDCGRVFTPTPAAMKGRAGAGYSYCPACRSAKRKLEWKTNRDSHRRTTYGLEPEEYERILAAQGGACAICTQPFRLENRRALAVDHCHETGRVRGLLCQPCNTVLGLMEDNPVLLRKAAAYLEP